MEPGQIAFATVLVIVLVGVAVFFLWRQWLTFRQLRYGTDLSPEDRTFLRNQAWRRLVSSMLMLVLAGLLAFHFVLERPINELLARDQAQLEQGKAPEQTDARRQLVNVYGAFWGLFLLALLSVIALAGFDYLAIRNYARRQYAKIREGRRVMIEEQIARLRSQRNGHG
jgi:hypothetical protein